MSIDKRQEEFYSLHWGDAGNESANPDGRILDEDKRKGLNILSLGCAAGRDIWHLVGDHQVCGIDFSETGVAIAREHGIEAIKGSITDPLPYEDNSFDILIAKDVIEHVLDPVSVMEEIHRVLRPDGHLVINIPNQFYWWFRLRILFGSNLIWKTFMHDQTKMFNEWDYIHVRFFTWKGLCKLLNLTGFRITKKYFDFGCLETYFNPYEYYEMYRKMWRSGGKKSKRGILICYLIYPLYRLLNILLPKRVRSKIVSLNPGFLTASFYLRCALQEKE